MDIVKNKPSARMLHRVQYFAILKFNNIERDVVGFFLVLIVDAFVVSIGVILFLYC